MGLIEKFLRLFGGRQAIDSTVNAEVPPALPAADSTSSLEGDPVREKYIRRERFLITDRIVELLPAEERFTIIEGGAGDSFRDRRWQAFDPPRKRVYGFEPSETECASLNARAHELGLDYRFFPTGLWSSTTRRALYENKTSGGNSFFPQNVALTNRWKFENTKEKFLATDIFYPLGTTSEWDLTSIDAWASDNSIIDLDFLKLNVQGAELEILKGATGMLDKVIGIQVEMSFVESYFDRPHFSDIDVFLRSHHFAFYDFIGHHCVGRRDSPITVQNAPGLYPLLGQLIEGHGVYFKDPIELHNRGIAIDHLSPYKLLKLACFAEMYGQIEFAFELLYWMVANRPATDELGGAIKALADDAVATYRRYAGG